MNKFSHAMKCRQCKVLIDKNLCSFDALRQVSTRAVDSLTCSRQEQELNDMLKVIQLQNMTLHCSLFP